MMLEYFQCGLSEFDMHYVFECFELPFHSFFLFRYVGRERMGTAFPHKKLSGNGVPTREILRNIIYYCHYITYFPLL